MIGNNLKSRQQSVMTVKGFNKTQSDYKSNQSFGSNAIKIRSETFNNVYKVRHLLDEISMFVGDLNAENIGIDLSGYVESMRTCQGYIEDIIESGEGSEVCNKENYQENVLNRMNGLLERVKIAKQENANLMKDASELFDN